MNAREVALERVLGAARALSDGLERHGTREPYLSALREAIVAADEAEGHDPATPEERRQDGNSSGR